MAAGTLRLIEHRSGASNCRAGFVEQRPNAFATGRMIESALEVRERLRGARLGDFRRVPRPDPEIDRQNPVRFR